VIGKAASAGRQSASAMARRYSATAGPDERICDGTATVNGNMTMLKVFIGFVIADVVAATGSSRRTQL